jgi:alkanesulfonate monooxygenase SsuD/methylene tetrahydromethanopterin reductase-like flavin-dependent oxidoreductase (luciferase family)
MRYALNMPNFGSYANIPDLVALAKDAEAAGWDGFFLWDHISPAASPGAEFCDPWMALTPVALATEGLRIGTMITPLPRRRPWVLARQVATLDQLSNGRVTLGVGIGYPPEEYRLFGEETDERVRADKLDEGLEILAGLLSGEPFRFAGEQYQVDEVAFLPAAVQAHVPVWVAGMWPNRRPMRRAARWDGAFPIRADIQPLTPDEVREIRGYVEAHRESSEPFELVLSGESSGYSPFALKHPLAVYEAAGVTWWLETLTDWRGTLGEMREYVRGGPPG